jgi:hypothetical protein
VGILVTESVAQRHSSAPDAKCDKHRMRKAQSMPRRNVRKQQDAQETHTHPATVPRTGHHIVFRCMFLYPGARSPVPQRGNFFYVNLRVFSWVRTCGGAHKPCVKHTDPGTNSTPTRARNNRPGQQHTPIIISNAGVPLDTAPATQLLC